LWNALKRREFAILDFARRATAPSGRVENGSRRKNAVRWTERTAVWPILNEVWKSKMEILVKISLRLIYNCAGEVSPS
jgi:hypothetical protein